MHTYATMGQQQSNQTIPAQLTRPTQPQNSYLVSHKAMANQHQMPTLTLQMTLSDRMRPCYLLRSSLDQLVQMLAGDYQRKLQQAQHQLRGHILRHAPRSVCSS